jgi:Tfp pilus assembly protein PilF
LQSAIVQFRRAIELDPRFALAHAALADAHTTLGYLLIFP